MKQETAVKFMKKITVLLLLSFLVLASVGYFAFRNIKSTSEITNQGRKKNQPQLTPQQSKIEMTLVDKVLKQPLANKKVIIRKVIYCKVGVNCILPILFQGNTDRFGKIKVDTDVFDSSFNIEVEGYFGNGPFKKEKDTNIYYYYTYSDGTTYTTHKFDYKKDKIIILIGSKK